MTKEKSTNNASIGIKHFESLFLKRKKKYPVSYFHYPLNTRKKNISLPEGLFKKTISTYLNIYFGELYFHDTPKYFFLSGLIKKAKGSKVFVNSKRGINHFGRCITWIWYKRPSISYFSNIRFIKMNGSTNRVLKLDNEYKDSRDVELLPLAKDEIQNLKLFKS